MTIDDDKTMDLPKPAPRDCVEDYHLESANELLDLLNPRNAVWGKDPTAWIFRGQTDARWELKAKAVRAPGEFAKCGIGVASVLPGFDPADGHPPWALRAGLLKRMLTRFRAGLDRSGLVIPTAAPPIDVLETAHLRSSMDEPEREAFPLMALAQHHGLPTILLDWTKRSSVAAYFAAAEAADPEKRRDATHLAVWALYRGDLPESSEGPNFYEPPGGTNPNLLAQSGLFTVLSNREDDPSIELHLACLKELIGTTLDLRRFTLPVSQAGRLLRLLAYEGVTGASMFPGADGVVKAMRETVLWDAPPA